MFVLDEQAFLKDPSGSPRRKRRGERPIRAGGIVARKARRSRGCEQDSRQIAPPGARKHPPAKGVAAN